MLTAAADGVYYQAFNDWEINYTDTMGRALVYAIDKSAAVAGRWRVSVCCTSLLSAAT